MLSAWPVLHSPLLFITHTDGSSRPKSWFHSSRACSAHMGGLWAATSPTPTVAKHVCISSGRGVPCEPSGEVSMRMWKSGLGHHSCSDVQLTNALMYPKDTVAYMLKIEQGQFTLERFMVTEMVSQRLKNLLEHLLLKKADLFADLGSILTNNKGSSS